MMPLVVLWVWVVFLWGLWAYMRFVQTPKMKALFADTREAVQRLAVNVDASFQRCLDSIDASLARMDASAEEREQRWQAQDKRFDASWSSIGVEHDLSFDAESRVVSGWAY
jgi:hypothetical protein